jgi:hypothetical protein
MHCAKAGDTGTMTAMTIRAAKATSPTANFPAAAPMPLRRCLTMIKKTPVPNSAASPESPPPKGLKQWLSNFVMFGCLTLSHPREFQVGNCARATPASAATTSALGAGTTTRCCAQARGRWGSLRGAIENGVADLADPMLKDRIAELKAT